MYPHVAQRLIAMLTPAVPSHPQGIPPHLQVLSIIRFISEGGYQKGFAENGNSPMSQPSASRYLHKVVDAINSFCPFFIYFPRTREERLQVSAGFERVIGFPGVLGAIDCSFVNIVRPHEDEHAYFNYKGNHALYVQAVTDAYYNILSLRICSGSTNDRFIWRWSEPREYMHELRRKEQHLIDEPRYYVIGDGGYEPSAVLLTAIGDAQPGTPAHRFSTALRRTRVKVEQTFGVWKSKTRCVNKQRTLYYKPEFAAKIIQASAVIHNFIKRAGVPHLNFENDIRNIPDNPDLDIEGNVDERLVERQRIIDQYFINL